MVSTLQTNEIRGVKNVQPIKMVMLGVDCSGKSTLAQRLLHCTEQSAGPGDATKQAEVDIELLDDLPERREKLVLPARVCNLPYRFMPCRSPNGLQFQLLELASPEVGAFNFIQPHLLDADSLVVITFDSRAALTATRTEYDRLIGAFLNLVKSYAPTAVVYLVGTHADYLARPPNRRNVYLAATTGGAVQLSDSSSSSAEEEEKEPDNDGADICAKLKKYLDFSPAFQALQFIPFVTFVGLDDENSQSKNLNKMWFDLERLVLDKKLFAGRHYYAPSTWDKFRRMLVRNFCDVLLLPLAKLDGSNGADDARLAGIEYRPRGEELVDCLAHWHSTGDALWFKRHPKLRDYVVLRPASFAQLLSKLLQADAIFPEHFLRDQARECSETKARKRFMAALTRLDPRSVDIAVKVFRASGQLAFALLRYLLPVLELTTTTSSSSRGNSELSDRENAISSPDSSGDDCVKAALEPVNLVGVFSRPLEAYHCLQSVVKLLQCGIDVREHESLVQAVRASEETLLLKPALVLLSAPDFTARFQRLVLHPCESPGRLVTVNCVLLYQVEPVRFFERCFSSLANHLTAADRRRPIVVERLGQVDPDLAVRGCGREANIEFSNGLLHLIELEADSAFTYALACQVEYSRAVTHFIHSPDSASPPPPKPVDPLPLFMQESMAILHELSDPSNEVEISHPFKLVQA